MSKNEQSPQCNTSNYGLMHLIFSKNDNSYLIKNRQRMESSFYNTISCSENDNCCKPILPHPNYLESLAEQSPNRQQTPIEPESHSLLNSIQLKHMPPSLLRDSRDFALEHLGGALESDRLDVSFAYIGLSRGISQNYEYFEEESFHFCMPYSTIEPPRLPQDVQQMEEPQQMAVSSRHPSSFFLPNSEQELKSDSKNNDWPCSSSIDEQKGLPAGQAGLKVTKNVTKNIGKLLFKFIWKNRKILHQRLGVEKSEWESFIKVISLWKKQNNITRQYLMRRWQGEGQHCALFRRLSRHFFRIRCLPAIMKSHIRLKRVHFQRIQRFSAAITDPESLASLV